MASENFSQTIDRLKEEGKITPKTHSFLKAYLAEENYDRNSLRKQLKELNSKAGNGRFPASKEVTPSKLHETAQKLKKIIIP